MNAQLSPRDSGSSVFSAAEMSSALRLQWPRTSIVPLPKSPLLLLRFLRSLTVPKNCRKAFLTRDAHTEKDSFWTSSSRISIACPGAAYASGLIEGGMSHRDAVAQVYKDRRDSIFELWACAPPWEGYTKPRSFMVKHVWRVGGFVKSGTHGMTS